MTREKKNMDSMPSTVQNAAGRTTRGQISAQKSNLVIYKTLDISDQVEETDAYDMMASNNASKENMSSNANFNEKRNGVFNTDFFSRDHRLELNQLKGDQMHQQRLEVDL